MADNEKLGVILNSLDRNNLISAFNSLMAKSHDTIDRQDVVDNFEEEYPGLYEFVQAIDEVEDDGFFDSNEHGISSDKDGLGEHAYGMLLGFLVLREIANEERMKTLFKF